MKKLKAAVIGVGGISVNHIDNYIAHPDVDLVAFCDINPDMLKKRGEQYGIKNLFADYNEMLAKMPEIDIVSVCTWNSAHAPATIAALNAGKHVLCEKPMAMNAAEAEQRRQAAIKNKRVLQVGFVRRFARDAALIRDFSAHGNLGDLYYARAAYVRRNGNPGGWFGDKSRSGGGPLIDLGVHVIDLVRYLMGNPQPVAVSGATFCKLGDRRNIVTPKAYVATSAKPNDVCDVEDMAVALIRFDNGAVLNLQAGFSLNIGKDEMDIELFGTKGGVKLDPEFKLFTEMNDYLADVQIAGPTAFDFVGAFRNEVYGFVAAVKGEAPVVAPAEDGVTLMRILDAVYRSAETGREVLL